MKYIKTYEENAYKFVDKSTGDIIIFNNNKFIFCIYYYTKFTYYSSVLGFDDNNFVVANEKEKLIDKIIKPDIYFIEHEDFEEQDLYSLRHFFITSHLIASKISVYDLAKYCGTSLQQISNTYDNVKMEEISKKMLSYSFKFDKNNNIILDDDINDMGKMQESLETVLNRSSEINDTHTR